MRTLNNCDSLLKKRSNTCLQILSRMLKLLWLVVLFYLIKTNEGKVSNEIFSILPDITNGILTLPNETHHTPPPIFPNRKSIESVRVINKSLLGIPVPDSNVSSLVCFPGSDEEYRNVFILSHITCRMMGFMTFSSIRPKMSPLDRASIKPTNLSCSSGLQRDVFSCKSLQNTTENCRMVTEVNCGACNGTTKGFKGVIQSPGFPFVSFADVTCEWNIMVPENHGIILSFENFDAIDMESANIPCGLHKPYIHIMYGIQSKVTILRYCRLHEVQNLSIPFHTVKIIVFTGLQQRQETGLSRIEQGISITFEATVPAEESYDSPLKMLAFFLLGVIFVACLILCHYIEKHKLCDCLVKDRNRQFLPHPMEQAYDLHNYDKTRIEKENVNLNKCQKEDGAKAEKVEFPRNSKMVYESGKGFDEHSSLLESSTRFIPSVARKHSVDDKEQLNINLHNKLNLTNSYHGHEDPNKLSVSSPSDYYDYPSFTTSRQASSASCMEDEKETLEPFMSTC